MAPPPDAARTFESDKWVRGLRGDETIVDSKRSLLVWKDDEVVPRLAFPPDDVRIATDEFERVGEHVLVPWDAADKWLEEDEEMVGHARDPFKRLDVRASSRHVRVERDGGLLAETTRPLLLFETGLPTRAYMPREDVRAELMPSETRTHCPYKGDASYWSVRRPDGEVLEDAVWSYQAGDLLSDGPVAIADHVAFLHDDVEVRILEPDREPSAVGS